MNIKKQAIQARILKLLDKNSDKAKFFKSNRNIHILLCDYYWNTKGGNLAYNSMHQLKKHSMNDLLKKFLPNITKNELVELYIKLVK